jgi:4,5:9,10-diseco-3-hydroxy-5,9,17-trioxoandrosta-1(10),2-diene-4-oate hydrolase
MKRTVLAMLSLVGCAPALRTTTTSTLRYELAAPAPDLTRTVLGVELHLHDSDASGGKPVLVCLHAIGHGGGDFAALSAALPEWRVIAVDWPGHGRLGNDPEPASAIRYAQLLAGLMDKLRLERVVVLGNSIGGAAAVRYAAAHPERVRALILANPGGLDPGGSSLLGRFFIGGLVSHFEQGARNEERFGPWFREYYSKVLMAPAAQQQRERIIAAGYESAPVLTQAWNSFMQPEASLAALAPKVTQPVLFTWADADEIITWSRNEEGVRRFPNAKVEHFVNSAHAAFLEEPEKFLEVLEPFLERAGK